MNHCNNCGEMPDADFYSYNNHFCKECVKTRAYKAAAIRRRVIPVRVADEPVYDATPVEPLSFSGLMDLFYKVQDLRVNEPPYWRSK